MANYSLFLSRTLPIIAMILLSEYPVTFRSLATGGHKGVCEARDSTWTQMNQDDVFRGMGITVSQERTPRQALVYVYDVPARLILGQGEGRPSSWQVLPSQPPARRSPPRHPPVQQPQQSSGQHMHLYPQQATEALTHLAYRYNDTGSLTKKASWERK
jgi:hypothetical protein